MPILQVYGTMFISRLLAPQQEGPFYLEKEFMAKTVKEVLTKHQASKKEGKVAGSIFQKMRKEGKC